MNEKLIIPASIVIAGLIIGAAIYFGGSTQGPTVVNNQPGPATVAAKKVDATSDRIQGNPQAEVFIIEYSDIECPFCKRYHDGPLAQLKENYADDDRVAFVFRHFPLDEPYTSPIHPNATEIHIAAECVAKLAGDEAFFNFIDIMFASDDRGDEAKFTERAVTVGVEANTFNTCYGDKDTEPIVAAGFQDGVSAGVQGTPTIMIQTAEGNTYPAVPEFGALQLSIDAYLSDLE